MQIKITSLKVSGDTEALSPDVLEVIVQGVILPAIEAAIQAK